MCREAGGRSIRRSARARFIDRALEARTAAPVERGDKADALRIRCVVLEPGGDGSMTIEPSPERANTVARDLRVARHDPVGALAAFTESVKRRIDVGEAARCSSTTSP